MSYMLVQNSLFEVENEHIYNLSTKIPEINLFAYAYRLFHEDFSPIYGLCVPYRALYHLWFQNKSELYKTYAIH